MNKIALLDELMKRMWNDYVDLIPQAQKIVKLLESHGELVVNDHIALRTFDIPHINIDIIAKPFVDAGYKHAGDYIFEDKKLVAKHYEHSDEKRPKVFISALQLDSFSTGLQKKIRELAGNVASKAALDFFFSCSGRPWDISYADYQILLKESEYAAWVAAHGFRPNHFTIYMNHLKKFKELNELNIFLKSNGFQLNTAGGEIKGTKEVFLEQSSTLADNIMVKFSDKTVSIPSCYYEFAKRYEMPNGKIYQGFVAKSADKIFESTNTQKN